MTQNTNWNLQAVASALAEPRDDQPVIDINHEHGFIDYKGKLGKVSLAFAYQDTGYVVTGVCSDVDELGDDECRIWLSPVEDLDDV